MTEQGAVRVSDAEREQVAERLVAAHGEGRLTLAEYDERVRAAHAAVVRDDLTPLLADLPRSAAPARPAPTRRREPALPAMPMAPPGPCGSGRGAVAVWATVSLVNVVIWLAVSVGTAAVVYPWWIWVAGPWGVALALGGLGRATVRPRA
ncbi:DUF1707 domain-containing protein [Actinomycetospora sp. NBRC 106378]|uniref:DUF1707 SHOCT-like domain-containing protein n=1 Tax=Actinomycetospora sp. NBRC 106378 TaxID=3032208 RepID=UPI0024A33F2D|nr:DUF1707 domain-containing protein [Actinomycetospora sp. NBRC 106378]GLZ50791.1 hypothetical protein Acsp07_04080 [Actinomycetospora sp. NBRC 106378]